MTKPSFLKSKGISYGLETITVYKDIFEVNKHHNNKEHIIKNTLRIDAIGIAILSASRLCFLYSVKVSKTCKPIDCSL
jgi:hypothetical protein